ncbi:hypothetical protein ACQR3P_28595 [Rhodococcus sp. IEGM1300]
MTEQEEYEREIQEWLKDQPEFGAPVPFSNASPENDPYEEMLSRSERFSLTSTFRGYEEIIAITKDHLERYEKDGPINETNPIVRMMGLMRDKASHQLKMLRTQFMVKDEPIEEVEQLEAEMLANWRAILGVDHEHEDGLSGHEVGEFEQNQREISKLGTFHRQIADLGMVHQNRIQEWLDILDLLEEDLIFLDGRKEMGVSHFAANVATMDINVVSALLVDELEVLKKKWERHIGNDAMFTVEVIDALHASQDADYRARSGYESDVILQLMEAEDEASPMFDMFAEYLTRAGSRVKDRSAQAQGSLLSLFMQEAEWLGEAWRIALEMREVAQFVELTSIIGDAPSITPSSVEKIAIKQGYGATDGF